MNEEEALAAIAGGADIIDVKNPLEGSLGANFPWLIKRIQEITPENIEVSCTIGEAPNLPGSMSLAAFGAASLGVDYVKVGIFGSKNVEEVVYLVKSVTRAAKQANPRVKVVVAGYADSERFGGIAPVAVPEIVCSAKADVVMIDTAVKDGQSIFDLMSLVNLREIVDLSHEFGLEVALAGSLRRRDLPVVCDLGADVVGVRGAACTGGDRVNGVVTSGLVRELVETVRRVRSPDCQRL